MKVFYQTLYLFLSAGVKYLKPCPPNKSVQSHLCVYLSSCLQRGMCLMFVWDDEEPFNGLCQLLHTLLWRHNGTRWSSVHLVHFYSPANGLVFPLWSEFKFPHMGAIRFISVSWKTKGVRILKIQWSAWGTTYKAIFNSVYVIRTLIESNTPLLS